MTIFQYKTDFSIIKTLLSFAIKAATEITGATSLAPCKKAIRGIKIVAAPPAATVLKNHPKKPRIKRIIDVKFINLRFLENYYKLSF